MSRRIFTNILCFRTSRDNLRLIIVSPSRQNKRLRLPKESTATSLTNCKNKKKFLTVCQKDTKDSILHTQWLWETKKRRGVFAITHLNNVIPCTSCRRPTTDASLYENNVTLRSANTCYLSLYSHIIVQLPILFVIPHTYI